MNDEVVDRVARGSTGPSWFNFRLIQRWSFIEA